MRFTREQQAAIDRREGELLLDAGAGSGKTRVLAERFALSVEQDGIAVAELLTITFTEKAAAELRERIRQRLADGCKPETAREAEAAWISTIHGFCARILRAHALRAGIDPDFTVLDAAAAGELAGAAASAAITDIAADAAGAELIAAYGIGPLQASVRALYEELRSGGAERPRLPVVAPPPVSLDAATARLSAAARALRAELLDADPTKSVVAALELLAGAADRIDAGFTSAEQVDALTLKGRGKAFDTEACERYRAAHAALKQLLIDLAAEPAAAALDRLLAAYGAHYRALKDERAALDFEDLQLITLRLLRDTPVGALYRGRFRRVMVDEAQDTNAVQFAVVDAIADGNLFMVGDAQQSIYGFRHADVELFRARGRELQQRGARLRLSVNFRADQVVMRVINAAFARELGPHYEPLGSPDDLESDADMERDADVMRHDPEVMKDHADAMEGDADAPSIRSEASDARALAKAQPAVELIQVSRDIDYGRGAGPGHWRIADAQVLAARIAELIAHGEHTAGEIVILARASTGFQVFEQALAARSVPTYVVGGRGYWQQSQVAELVAYLKALCSRADTDAWYAALLSPLCGLSLDGLVSYAAAGEASLSAADAERLTAFTAIYERQRAQTTSLGAEQLLYELIGDTGYDLAVAALPGGRRRLANIRKLRRLARDHEAAHGPDLRGFLDWIALRSEGEGLRESEAPLATDGIDAVRLMTIHASKGLEFPVVCVADLGRQRPRGRRPLVRVDRCTPPGIGLLLKTPGHPEAAAAFDYERLAASQQELEADEERRLFYVAMTRAERRLILSGAASTEKPDASAPIAWIAPLLSAQPEVRQRLLDDTDAVTTFLDAAPTVTPTLASIPTSESTGAVEPIDVAESTGAVEPVGAAEPPGFGEPTSAADGAHSGAAAADAPSAAVATLSYSALATYDRCPLRFKARYVLGLPETESGPGPRAGTPPKNDAVPEQSPSGAERGTAIHELLARVDLRHPAIPPGTDPAVAAAVEPVLGTETFGRMRASAPLVRREQPFAFQHAGLLVTGVFDVFIRSPADGSVRVIDYKSDVLRGRSPAALIDRHYGAQRLIYALAALGTGAAAVTLAYLFVERPREPVIATFTDADQPDLLADLTRRTARLLSGDFAATGAPGRLICNACPARGTICPHPYDATLAE